MSCPNGYYCFKVNLFNISTVVIIGVILVLYFYSYRNLSTRIDLNEKKQDKKENMVNYNYRPDIYEEERPEIVEVVRPQLPPAPEYLPVVNNVNQLFLDRIMNPLSPPEQTYINPAVPINIPTRGEPDQFQQVGFLVNKHNKNNLMPLFGRQTYPGSSNWNYYTNNEDNIKQPIIHNNNNCMDLKGCSEVYGNDHIRLQGNNKQYKVEKYNYTQPRYIPYV
tara:strand:+ start:961 stop:1623 length:663 start_codon:yes stop_codon:yes gene_type:complete